MKIVFTKYIEDDKIFSVVKSRLYDYASKYLKEDVSKIKLIGVVIPKTNPDGSVNDSKLMHILICEKDSWENLAADIISIGKKEKIFAHKVESIIISSTLDKDKPLVDLSTTPYESIPDNSRIYLTKALYIKGNKFVQKSFVRNKVSHIGCQ